MQIYEATPYGEEIANDSGLSNLTSRLAAADYLDPLILQLVDEHSFRKTEAEVEEEAIQKALGKLKTFQEMATFDQGLQIVPLHDSWRQVGKDSEGTLFPIDAIDTFVPASNEDRLILSGVAGLQLTNYRGSCSLLARNRFTEFGFNNFAEACAFVGAYVVGKINSAERKRSLGQGPSFSFAEDGVLHEVSVSGTFHGDFIMAQDRMLQSGIISPTGKPEDYGPVETLHVSGNYSIKPDILETMIYSEFLKGGKEKAIKLVDELLAVIKTTELFDEEGKIRFTRGNFGDYGDHEHDSLTLRTEMLLREPDYLERERNSTELHSSPYAAQSEIIFEIVAIEEGIKFQNRDVNSPAPVRDIEIKREHYDALFNALLIQSQNGLGRTSPHQLLNLLFSFKRMLG